MQYLLWNVKRISGFFGDYRWLSNFWPSKVLLDHSDYPTIEHAYQAAKTTNSAHRFLIRKAKTPGEAKRLGKTLVTLRPDWEVVKIEVMRQLVRQKFLKQPFRAQLLETGDADLIEENSWGDTFWGVCRGVGRNELGKILMRIRAELRAA